MALTPSTMLPLGTKVPSFALPATDGTIVRDSDFAKAPALLVMFICNHCPYVKHIRDGLAVMARDFANQGVAVVGIMSNNAAQYPDDRPEMMKVEKQDAGWDFPYLYDESQDVAKAYHAACTPDFFLFDGAHKLVYRGQMDDSRPGNNQPVTGRDLRAAVGKVLANEAVDAAQKPSIGCNIKWKPGNEPGWFSRR
ncbi:MAG: thioredoxin family protein [Proteobacteria bacterium]|nr:thioredoxin family protein [Pseudomonadota bacterium]